MFEGKGEERGRRGEAESAARTRAEQTRQTMLELLREGPLKSVDLRARLDPDTSISVVNYHLSVLVSEGKVVSAGDLYRLP